MLIFDHFFPIFLRLLARLGGRAPPPFQMWGVKSPCACAHLQQPYEQRSDRMQCGKSVEDVNQPQKLVWLPKTSYQNDLPLAFDLQPDERNIRLHKGGGPLINKSQLGLPQLLQHCMSPRDVWGKGKCLAKSQIRQQPPESQKMGEKMVKNTIFH